MSLLELLHPARERQRWKQADVMKDPRGWDGAVGGVTQADKQSTLPTGGSLGSRDGELGLHGEGKGSRVGSFRRAVPWSCVCWKDLAGR